MTTLDKTGIEAARDEFVHSTTKEQIERWAYKWADDLLSTADALSSLPAQAVGVKTLEWSTSANRWTAQHAYGEYEIVRDHRATSSTTHGWFSNGQWIWFGSLDEAKAAAQADCEARVRSAVVAAQAPAEQSRRDLEQSLVACRTLEDFLTVQKTVLAICEAEISEIGDISDWRRNNLKWEDSI